MRRQADAENMNFWPSVDVLMVWNTVKVPFLIIASEIIEIVIAGLKIDLFASVARQTCARNVFNYV